MNAAKINITIILWAFSIHPDCNESLPSSRIIDERNHQKRQDELDRFEKVLGKSCILFRNL